VKKLATDKILLMSTF